MTDDLLKPSLDARPVEPIFSTGALMAAAFLGGGFAIVALAGENMRRLKRLSSEWPWLLLGASVTVAAMYLSLHLTGRISGEGGSQETRMINRGVGLALWGLYYFLHRQHLRAMQTFGLKPPKPVIPVIAAIVFAIACTALVVALTMQFPMDALL